MPPIADTPSPLDATPEFVPVLRAARMYSVDGVRDGLASLQDAGDEAVTVASGLLARTPGTLQVAQAWTTRTPSDRMARAVWSHVVLTDGWLKPTGLRGTPGEGDKADRFAWAATRAERVLTRLCAQQPDFPLGWYLRILTARALHLGPAEVRRRHERLAAVQPTHFPGHDQALQGLLPAWGGTWDVAFEFARTVAAAAPVGSAGRALIALAHLERWRSLGGHPGYLAQPGVGDELSNAAAGSVWHPAFATSPHRISLHTAFAVLARAAGNADLARRHILVLDAEPDPRWLGPDTFEAELRSYRAGVPR